MATHQIDVEIGGEGVHPAMIPFRELADYLVSLEQAVLATAKDQGIELEPGEPPMALTGVQEGSTRLKLCVVTALMSSLGVVSTAIRTQSPQLLPREAAAAIARISRQTSETGHTFRILPDQEYGVVEAMISAETTAVVQAQAQTVTGVTTLYGRCVEVGGERRPHAVVKLLDGPRITVALVDTALAVNIARLLYEEVQLEGEATWVTPSWQLYKFRATEVKPVSVIPADQAFDLMAKSSGQYWQGVDAEEYVQQLRYGRRLQ